MTLAAWVLNMVVAFAAIVPVFISQHRRIRDRLQRDRVTTVFSLVWADIANPY